jgi:competence protein ComEC
MQQEHRKVDLHGLTLVVGISAWLAGMLIDSFILVPSFALLSGAVVIFLLIVLLWRDSQSRLIMCILLCLLLGAWRYSTALLTNDPHALSASLGMSLVVRGTVSDEPELYGSTRLLSVTASEISRDDGSTWQDADGQLTVQTPGTTVDDPYGANYGSVVEIQGKLQPPLPHSSPAILANMFFPRVQVTDTAANPVLATLYSWRITLSNILAQVLPQPEAALLIAIVLGLHTPTLRPLISVFNITGTAHLIVPSGFKVTLLAGLVTRSTRWLHTSKKVQEKLLPAQKHRDWRRWLSTFLVIISIAVYTVLSGAGAAAIRAGVMGILLVLTPRIGRTYNVYTALAFTALLMGLGDPFVLWDSGFQLSFLGTLGIIVLTPFFQRLLHPVTHLPLGHILTEILAVTLAAQVATLPILYLDFQVLSPVAPLANILTVPLLGTLITLGILICITGLLLLPLALVIGWVALPLLKYILYSVQWCASLPGAAINIPFNSDTAWCYYAVLALLVTVAIRKWPTLATSTEHTTQQEVSGLSQRTWKLIQLGMALLIIVSTGITAFAAQANANLTITFLDVTSKGQPQGESILLRTPDNKTLLIDGGLDAASLAQELDSRLPSWQRSLDAVLLTTPRQDHLVGLLDIVQRYAIGEIIDAGMLHPGTTYSLWRRTISERNIPYLTARQGTNITIGSFVSLQILWPASPLHKGSNEVRDNGLILRIVTPGLRILLLGAGAQSTYALSGLLNTVDTTYLHAEIVQMIEEASVPFPVELDSVLQRANPALLLMTPAAISKKKKTATSSTIQSSISTSLQNNRWQDIPTVRTAQLGTIEIQSNRQGWSVNTP